MKAKTKKPAGTEPKSAGYLHDSRKPKSKKPPSEAQAATAIARAWLAKGGFHEDETGESAERIEILDTSFDDNGDYFVDVRVYIPNLDIEHVVEGTHIDGITVDES